MPLSTSIAITVLCILTGAAVLVHHRIFLLLAGIGLASIYSLIRRRAIRRWLVIGAAVCLIVVAVRTCIKGKPVRGHRGSVAVRYMNPGRDSYEDATYDEISLAYNLEDEVRIISESHTRQAWYFDPKTGEGECSSGSLHITGFYVSETAFWVQGLEWGNAGYGLKGIPPSDMSKWGEFTAIGPGKGPTKDYQRWTWDCTLENASNQRRGTAVVYEMSPQALVFKINYMDRYGRLAPNETPEMCCWQASQGEGRMDRVGDAGSVFKPDVPPTGTETTLSGSWFYNGRFTLKLKDKG